MNTPAWRAPRSEAAREFVPIVDDLLLASGITWLFGGQEAEDRVRERMGAWESEMEQAAREQGTDVRHTAENTPEIA